MEVFDTRPLDAEDYVALWVDAIEVWGRKFLLCMGVTAQGRKHMLGVVEGREYDRAAVRQLLDDLERRGLNASEGLLGITSGSAQLSRVLTDYFGPQLKSQYCQMHKRQRVLSVCRTRSASEARLRAPMRVQRRMKPGQP
ncbi:MAG: transposase [Bacteroidota bacterium]|nr:transposase [Bacteroidota bacterium]